MLAMAPGRPLQQGPRTFDDAKLSSMTEPLSLRVEKLKGASRTPIPLPQPGSDDGGGDDAVATSVTGYTIEDVRGIEQWLVTKWVGGGLYEVTVTDSSSPQIIMKWQPYWDPKQYPELTPAPLADAAAPIAPTVTNLNPRVPMSSAFPNGLPAGASPAFAPTAPSYAREHHPSYYNQMPAPPPVGSQSWSAWQHEAERRKVEDELKALRERERDREREAIEARHKAEVDRLRIESESRAASTQRAFETKLAEMQASMTALMQQHATKASDPEIEKMREQMRATEARAERDRNEREAERRDQAMRDMIKAQAEESRRQVEAMQRVHEQQLAAIAAQANKPDAMKDVFLLIQEQARMNAESVKEIARQNDNAITRLQGFMLNPLQMMQLAKESQAGAEQATERVTNFFGRVVEMQQRVTENALQMQPGGSGVMDVVREGMGGLKEFAEKFVGAKSANEKFSMQAQAQVAEAQARAYEAQMRAAHPQPQPEVVHAPPPPRVQEQLAGVRVPKVSPESTPEPASADTTKRLGRTDLEWFTPALIDEVMQLREGVDTFIEACGTIADGDADVDEIEGVSPADTVEGIMAAVQAISTHQVIVPAMMDLLFQERYADFVDVLIPDATQAYRDEAVQLIIAELRTLTNKEPEPKPATKVEPKLTVVAAPSDGDADDDDDDSKPFSPPPSKPKKNGARPARA